jgi:molybdopterin molybdotransferase
MVPPGKVRDINIFTLAAQIESAGAEIGLRAKVPDRLEELVSACLDALSGHDLIVLSGGSSVGVRDYTLQTLERLPDSKLLVHGVAIRPGKPVILGLSGEKVFWGLPGQPVSALITCRVFVVPSLDRLQGRSSEGTESGALTSFRAILARRLPSVHGRTDFVPVSLSTEGDGVPSAVPIFGKSGAISILARADGYVIVPEHAEGYDTGAEVTVHPFF